MPWNEPPDFVNGVVVSESDLDNLGNNLRTGVWRPIQDAVLIASASSLDFTSIPATFRHLAIALSGWSTDAAASIPVNLRCNNDFTAVYSYGGIRNSGTSVTGIEGLAQTAIPVTLIPGTGGSGSAMGAAWILIPGYAEGTRYQPVVALAGYRISDVSGGVVNQTIYGTFQSTAPIARVTLTPSAGNFGIGTYATLYGCPGI
jgi:hypothetical protein